MTSSGLTILIPCLNESRTITRAVKDAVAALNQLNVPGEVLVVDNGSHDQSAALASAAGARVASERKQGYGFALRRGFAEARFEHIAMIDADLSYPMDHIPLLFKTLQEGHDFVLGNRLAGKIQPRAMPFLNRYLGTPVLSGILRHFFAIPTYDCNSGLRVFRKTDVSAMDLRSGGMEVASEMLVRVAELNLRYSEVVIPFYRDQRGYRSHLNRWQDGIRHLRLICNRKLNRQQAATGHQNPQQNSVNQRV